MFIKSWLPSFVALTIAFSPTPDAEAQFADDEGHARSAPMRGARPLAKPLDSVRASPRRGIGAVTQRLVRDCQQEGAHLQNSSFEAISEIVVLNEIQRRELDALRDAAIMAGERLVSECPKSPSSIPTEQLEVLERAINAADSAFATIEPVLQRFYASLDEEQKARLFRYVAMSRRKPQGTDRTLNGTRDANNRSEPNRGRGTSGLAAPTDDEPLWASGCRDFMSALRRWPVREIEQGLRLTDTQRIAFYELVSASLRAVVALADLCPAESPITPVRKMAVLRLSLQAMRSAAISIKPNLTYFFEALDEEQKAKFVEIEQ